MEPRNEEGKVEVVDDVEKKLGFERWAKTGIICLSFLVSLVKENCCISKNLLVRYSLIAGSH